MAKICLQQGCSTLESLVGKQPVEVEGIVVEAEADIGDAVEAQPIEGEATQQGEETRVATDAAGILAQGSMPQWARTAWAASAAARVTVDA